MAGGAGIAGGAGMGGGEGMSGTGICTVPSPSVGPVGSSGDGVVVPGGTTVSVSTVTVVVVGDVVVVVVSSPEESSPPHAVNSDATANPAAKAVRVDFAAAREVMRSG